MKILALETSGDPSSIALYHDGQTLAEDVFPSKMSLCEQLAPRILALAEVPSLAAAGLGAVAVSLGPGSFTGLRVGLATAKAIAHCLQLPLVGVSTALALAVEAGPAPGQRVWVFQPARRDRLYLSEFLARDDGSVQVAAAPRVVASDYGRAQVAAAGTLVVEGGCPRAATIAALAAGRIATARGDEHLFLRPFYVGKSQAERTHGVDLRLDGRLP